ncbi:hypothetical protein [Rhodocista pekingensis]|uniref:Uncharacterized protein n=1 Tax=Rhodocista pekingensis TaxID=201185 RepID=A0ABW2KV86_9PROT
MRPDPTAAQRRQRHAATLHRLGPRAVLELLEELERAHRLPPGALDDLLDSYATLDPAVLRALGGDRFPPRPIREVA